jgi:drug/metabolite transporter superfamily protein YnfA
MQRKYIQVLVMLAAAALEVGGDALIRTGLRGRGLLLVVLGFVVLGSYGIAINQLPLDFSKLLGAYVGFFALVSVLCGWLMFDELIANATWLGLAVVLAGSLIMQFGSSR